MIVYLFFLLEGFPRAAILANDSDNRLRVSAETGEGVSADASFFRDPRPAGAPVVLGWTQQKQAALKRLFRIRC